MSKITVTITIDTKNIEKCSKYIKEIYGKVYRQRCEVCKLGGICKFDVSSEVFKKHHDKKIQKIVDIDL